MSVRLLHRPYNYPWSMLMLGTRHASDWSSWTVQSSSFLGLYSWLFWVLMSHCSILISPFWYRVSPIFLLCFFYGSFFWHVSITFIIWKKWKDTEKEGLHFFLTVKRKTKAYYWGCNIYRYNGWRFLVVLHFSLLDSRNFRESHVFMW